MKYITRSVTITFVATPNRSIWIIGFINACLLAMSQLVLKKGSGLKTVDAVFYRENK